MNAQDLIRKNFEASGVVDSKIKLQDLTKIFGRGEKTTTALDKFSLDIAPGEFICVVGPSGCGKSTMLRILAGLETKTTGDVLIRADGGKKKPLNSMVFQEHSLFPWMTVIDNVAYGLEMRGIARRERHERAMQFIKTVGLAKFSNHYPHQLSGGMKQRASLARAFVNDPEILLMDEPFAALDAQNKVIMQDELLRIWDATGKTVIFITHSIDEALILSDRIVVMTAAPGRIKKIIPVDFPRPRNVIGLKADPRFGELYREIWNVLEGEVQKARELSEAE